MKQEVVHKTTTTFPILGLLGVAFVVLKLTGYIDWSWWLVTLPFWAGLAVFLGFLAIGGIVLLGIFLIALVADR